MNNYKNKIKELVNKITPAFQVLGKFAFQGEGDIRELRACFIEVYEAAVEGKRIYDAAFPDIPLPDADTLCATGSPASPMEEFYKRLKSDDFVPQPFDVPSYSEYTMTLNQLFIALQQAGHDAEDNMPKTSGQDYIKLVEYNGYTLVTKAGSERQDLGILDRSGNLVVPCEMDFIDIEETYIEEGDQYFSWLKEFGIIPLYKDDKTGFYFEEGHYIEPAYDRWELGEDEYTIYLQQDDTIYKLSRYDFSITEFKNN